MRYGEVRPGRAIKSPMKNATFKLVPHPADSSAPDILIGGRIHRSGNLLSVAFELHDPHQQVQMPPPADAPMRAHRLWEQTCFECFFATDQAPGYWEVNLSAAGHWNLYRFDSYRQGMRQEAAIMALPAKIGSQNTVLKIQWDMDLSPFLASRQRIKMALSAVIRTTAGETSHWALSHPCSGPDFHHRDGFVLDL